MRLESRREGGELVITTSYTEITSGAYLVDVLQPTDFRFQSEPKVKISTAIALGPYRLERQR